MASTEYKLCKEMKKCTYSPVQYADKPLPVSIFCALYKRLPLQLTEIIPCVLLINLLCTLLELANVKLNCKYLISSI
jgi:hypothetical protein